MGVKIIAVLLILIAGFTGFANATTYYCNSCSDCESKISSASAGDSVKLTVDIINYSVTCINNPANFVGKTFDCQGHAIDGDDSGTGYGIYLSGKSNNTIRDCVITDFDKGFDLDYSSNNNLINNIANSNGYNGFDLDYSSNNTIINNIANSNSYGFYLYPSSNYNTITNNTANSNSWNGFYLSSSSNNTLTNNTANSNTYAGFDLDYSSNNTIINNIANSNSYGFYLYPSSNYNTITNNTANSNSYGFYLYPSSNYNTITNNTANSNTYAGFDLRYSSGNTLTSNTANLNGGGGFRLFSSSNNTLTNNTANSNSYGIYLYSSPSNTLTSNTANSNSWYGIYSPDSANNGINSNIVCGNTNSDLLSSNWLSSSGDENTCDKPDGWNDTGTTGCTYSCPGEVTTTTTTTTSTTSTTIKPECVSDNECGDKVCNGGKCVEPKLTFVFVPVNWAGTMEDFDKKVDEGMDFFLNATPLKDCKGGVKIIRSHEACSVTLIDYIHSWNLLKIKYCAWRTTTNYNYVIGLTEDTLSDEGGYAIQSLRTAIVVVVGEKIENHLTIAHEIGHLVGLKDEYCNYKPIFGEVKCGFEASPNPLKSEYGCREKDSPYDNDNFPDCCSSDKYENACIGNVGVSDANAAKILYDKGFFDQLESVQKDSKSISSLISDCEYSKEEIKNKLKDLADSTNRLKLVINGYEDKLSEVSLGSLMKSADECPKADDICGCVKLYEAAYDLSLKDMNMIIQFRKYNIMVPRGGLIPTEFSKPAYDYLSTMPEMQCDSNALVGNVLSVDITVDINHTVLLNNLLVVEGKSTDYADGNYTIAILDANGNIVESQRLPIVFFMPGIGEVNTTPIEVRFSNFDSAKELIMKWNNTTIFETPITLCNNNTICDNYENYLSCPNDCPSGSIDKYCDKVEDGRCDPDCAKEVDKDCQKCLLGGDVFPCDDKVADFELLDYINKWVNGLVEDFDLLTAIDNWAKS